ncbi:MAG: hypothetical protein ABIS06_18775, partial [Vicinamibacterales bacterium]
SSNDIYVRSLDGSAKSRVSTDGGSAVVWSRDGRELFYRVGRRLMSVPVADGQTFQPGCRASYWICPATSSMSRRMGRGSFRPRHHQSHRRTRFA